MATYTPKNIAIFTAAYAGALAGMGVSERVITSGTASSYDAVAKVAGAYAKSYDTEWSTRSTTELDIAATREASYAAWDGRAPLDDAGAETLSRYTNQCRAIIAAIVSSQNYFAGIGVTPQTSSAGNPAAATQAAWHINALTGNDTNDGLTSGTAIKTWAELQARIGTQTISPPFDPAFAAKPLRIYIESDLPDSDQIKGSFTVDQDVAIGFFGGVRETLATGTFTAVTAKNAAANQPFDLTDAALPAAGFTPYVGKRVRITSGARLNTIMWVARDLAAKKFRSSTPAIPDQITNPDIDFWILAPGVVVQTPQVGDAYAVEELFTVTMGALSFTAPGAAANIQFFEVVFGQLEFRESDGLATNYWAPGCINTMTLSCWACKIVPVIAPICTFLETINCYNSHGAFVTAPYQSVFLAGLFGDSSLLNQGEAFGLIAHSVAMLVYDVMFEGVPIRGRSVCIQSACVFDTIDTSENRGGHAVNVGLLVIDNEPGSTGSGPPGGMCMGPWWSPTDGSGRLWGSGNAGRGVHVSPGSAFTFVAGNLPTVTGAGGDFDVANQATAFPFNTGTRVYDAAVACTWANLAGNNLHRPEFRASICSGV